jgi:hypothetical protein
MLLDARQKDAAHPEHLLEYGATDRVEGAWPGRANPLISRIHRATASLKAS